MNFGQFYRIKLLPPYVFSEVNALKDQARRNGDDVIDFGMGNPDQATPDHIVDKLIETVRNPKTHRYSNSRGIPGLRRAIASYYQRRFGVELDPESEVVVTIGSKEGLASLAKAITAPGDPILVPSPSYPIHPFGFKLSGAQLYPLPWINQDSFLSQLESFSIECQPKALIVNFPSNPTAQVVGLDFYRQVVEWARKRQIYLVSDLAYSEIYFDGRPPPSLLQVAGSREQSIEFGSLSKTYSMPGWRVGFAVGNRELISALARIKGYTDYGAFTPIQVAATAALTDAQDCVSEVREMYKARRDTLVEGLASAGWTIPSPPATMFAWAPIPQELAHIGSLDFAKLLLRQARVLVSPGICFGEHGEGYVRMALVENTQRIRQACRNIRSFLRNVRLHDLRA